MTEAQTDRLSAETPKQELVELAKAQGDAYDRALRELIKEARGGEKHAGNFIVGWACEEAEGLWVRGSGGQHWQDPVHENAHLEITVRDAADRRFVPCLRVVATLIDADGNEVGTNVQPFLWHPWVYHYGRNWIVPKSGTYRLRVHVDAPDFMCHDRVNGRRYADGADVEFEEIEIRTGRKKGGPQ